MFSATTVLDVRGGLNYYHNVTATTAQGLTTSTDVGIPGANLDDYTSGLSYINVGGIGDPLLGFSASQPWDRSEKTWNATATLTRLMHNHTVKLGGEWRHNRDLLLQTQDAGGPRGRFNFNCLRYRLCRASPRHSAVSPIRWRRSCSIGRTSCSAT